MAINSNRDTTKNSSRYNIERDIQKQIEPLELDIQALKKRYDKILFDAQKTFEYNEKKYQEALNKANKEHIRTLRQTRKDNEENIKAEQSSLNRIKDKHDEEIRMLVKTHEDKIQEIQKTIDRLNKYRNETLETIKNKHTKTTKTYQEKIKLYEENLQKNKSSHQDKLLEALDTLTTAYKSEQTALHSLEKELSEDFSRIEQSIIEKNNKVTDNLKQEKNTIDYRINSLRKSLNNTMKTVKNHLYKIGTTLKDPFEQATQQLNTFKEDTHKAAETFINSVEFDVKIETHRLNKMLEIGEDETVDKDVQNKVNEQHQLNTLRKNALIEHTQKKQKLIDETITMFKSVLMKTQQRIKKTFDKHETLLDSQLNRFKKKLDIVQNGNQETLDTLNRFMTVYHSEDILTPFKTLFEDIFAALHAFERKRITLLSDTLNTLKPYYDEIDDIRFFLDTKDALKEIRITEQKIDIEQRDASLKKEMELTKRQHDKKVLVLEHNQLLTEKKALQTIETEKQQQTINDLFASKTAQSERAEHRLEKNKHDLLLDLKKTHADTDITQVEQRQAIDESILERQKEINTLESLRHKRLKLEELTANKTTERERLKLKVEQSAQNLKRIEETISQRESRLEHRFERKKENALEEFNTAQKALETQQHEAEANHQKKLDFIKQAYERETAKAKRNLEEISTLKNVRISPIDTRHLTLKKQLLNNLKALDEATLKESISMLHSEFKESLFEHIHQTIKTLEDTNKYIQQTDIKKANDSEDNERKLTLQLNKINDFFDGENEKLEILEESMIHDIEETYRTPKDALKKKGNVSLREFKSMIKTFLNDLKQSLDSFKDKATIMIEKRFNPMEENDKALLKKAEKSYHHALDDEKKRYHEAIKPIEIKIKGLEDQYQQTLSEIEEELENVKQENISETYQKQAAVREELETQQEQLNTLDETLDNQKQAMEQRYVDDLEQIEQRHQGRLVSLKERYAKQVEKINERLEDAKNIHQQAIINTEHALESIEGSLNDTFDANNEHFDYIQRRSERTIESSKKEKDDKLKSAQESLNEKLEDFEEQILTSKARLEEKIEQVVRDLEDEVSVKESRKKQLDKSVSDNEYTLYSSFDEAFKELGAKIDTAFEKLAFETRQGQDELDALAQSQEEMLTTYIEETLKNIKSS